MMAELFQAMHIVAGEPLGGQVINMLRVPVANAQETTIRGSTVKTVEETESLLLCILQTKPPGFYHA
jgi:hypothetical protein